MADAAIVTVGTELVSGLRIDTNTAEVARTLRAHGFRVAETASFADHREQLADALRRLTARYPLVVVTGGLGPTHDDITREAASDALERPLEIDEGLVTFLSSVVSRHRDPESAEKIMSQAWVMRGARVLEPTTGTAPGQVIDTGTGSLVLLPGPPAEMRAMLAVAMTDHQGSDARQSELGVTGMGESDAQLAVSRALAPFHGVGFTILASPADIRVLLSDEGCGPDGFEGAIESVCSALRPNCYSCNGESLQSVVLGLARESGVMLATAESCTGGLVAAALTETPGSSAAFLGGVVSYDDQVKADVLGVPPGLLAQFGAVSEETARAMAEGARDLLGADVAVSVTGIAGPDGGTKDKPVGLVWFAVATRDRVQAHERRFRGGSRASVRARATATALDLVRRHLLSL